MQSTLSPHARMLVGLGAAAGAFGVAVMMSATSAPTARADDFTDTIATVDTEIADGQVAFSSAASDFGSNLLTPGVAAFFDGVDNDLLAAPNTLLAGTIEGLANEPYDINAMIYDLPTPGTFADGLTDAQTLFADSAGVFNDAATDLAAGDYGQAVLFDLFGVDLATVVPLEEVLLGSVASL
jgi:hypothetical protein